MENGGKAGEGGKGAGASAVAGAGVGAAPVLLLSPEDIVSLVLTPLFSGPVISGSVQPERRADLRAEVPAVVLQSLKENGESVRAGDLLMRLDDTAIRDSLLSAEDALRASTQTLDQSERQAQRLKTLQAQGMTSLQALEDAEIRRNNAHSDQVAAKARVVLARQQLQRTQVRAPFDGVVSDRKASAGDTVQVGKELLKVIDPRSMRLEGLVSADRMSELKPGQPVSFRVNGYAHTEFAGKLRRIDAAANATTRQVAVIADFIDIARAPHIAGLFAEGRVDTGGSQSLVLFETALSRVGEQVYVWRIHGNALVKAEVKLGDRDPRRGQLPVLSGLSAGDRILRNPGHMVVDGQKVEFAPEAAASGAAASTEK